SETVSGAVDASVTALVTAAEPQEGSAAQSTSATAQPLQWQAQYQSEIAALNASNQQLHTQVEQLSKQLDEIKALLAQQASAKNAAEPVASSNEPLAETQPQSPEAEAVTEPETPVEPATTTEPAAKESFFSQLFSNPINLGLLITLPALLVLALVSLWLRAKAKRELASREEVENSSESLLDEGDSHFDHLMAADMVGLGDLPDLEQKDETLQPQPEIVLEERTEPSFQLPDVDLSQPDGREPANRIGKATGWGDAGDPQLVPDVGRTDLGLNEQDLDLAHEMPAPSRGPAQALDEEAFLAELGVSQQDSQPEVVDEGLLHDEPEQPGVVQEADEFQPRESVNLSNDELEALFSSVEEHDAAEFITPATSEPVLTEMEPEPQSTEHTSDEELVLSQHMAELLVPTHEEEAPAANWYNEDDVALDLPAADQQESETSFAASESGFKGIDELLAEAEASSEKDEPYQGLSFDVGLDEFPEVLPGQQGVDVDADGGIGAKLDLARAYLEIDDKPSAIELLNEVLTQGSSEQQSEAERLLKRLV
ncbi:MAG: FimV/HubP family polar landmark protein, partial [Aeromonadaceae bacterium]